MGISTGAFAETIGTTGGGFMFGGGEAESRPVPPRPVPVVRPPQRTAEVIAAPLPPPTPPARPVDLAPAQPVSTGGAPYQASIAVGSTRCPDPVAHPNARNTPVKVYVDQQTQTVRIVTPDRQQPVESRVSTGGGLKIPNGKLKKAPYCARTPSKDRLVISAVTPEMFKGTGCTPDEIHGFPDVPHPHFHR
jgi:hypothetical protein